MRLRVYAAVITLSLCAAAVVLWKTAKNPSYQFFGDLLFRVNTQEQVVALTFDDGPGPNNTQTVLAILKEYSVPATFFMIGQNIEKYPELAKKVLNEGHQIANHSYSHKRMLLHGKAFCREEIARTDSLIRGLGFQDEIVFRPPFGKKLFTLPLALKELGKLSVTWDAESEDTETQDPAILENNVFSRVQPGSIILFHDGGARKEGTLSVVRKVIERLKTDGYAFLTVNELRRKALP